MMVERSVRRGRGSAGYKKTRVLKYFSRDALINQDPVNKPARLGFQQIELFFQVRRPRTTSHEPSWQKEIKDKL